MDTDEILKTYDSWELDEPYHARSLEEIRDQLLDESGFRRSIVDRGLKRLDDVVADGTNRWLLAGRPDLGDNFPLYTVCLDSGLYSCTCYGHQWGDSRQRRICSHVVAVIVARRLNRVQVKPSSQRLQLTPADLGLPPKFTEFRSVQRQALERIQASDKPYIFLQGPTGSGKTVIPPATQRLLKTKVLYIPFTIQLQDQFMGDFARDLEGKEWAIKLMGRSNYPTLRYPHLFPRINVSMCTSKKETHCRWCCNGDCNPDGITNSSGEEICLAKVKCPYRVQKAKALGAELAVVNTALFLNEANFVGGLSGWPWAVFDEADLLEGALMSHVELEITRRWIERLGLNPPARKTVEEAWIGWARNEAKPKVDEELERLQNQYGVEDMRRQQELERMQSKLDFFLREISATKWVFLPENERWVFKPVFVSRYADHYLWRHAKRFILMSATVVSPDEMAHSLGIPRDEIEFIDLPSTFPPERRPIFYQPAGNLTWKSEDSEFPKVVTALDRILDQHPENKILAHTVSYPRAKRTLSLSRHRERMLTYDEAKDRQSKLDEFRAAPPGTILVASSMDRGVDLPDDQCRVVVVLKVPYLNTKDKQVSARLHSDKKGGQLWYNVNAIRTLVQMTGRGMRSASDHCEIFILDAQFSRLYRENKYLFPEWWRNALKTLKAPKP